MDTLYVETNFLVGIATGRDVAASLLDDPASPIRLVIPGMCFLEALAWLEGEIRRRNDLRRQWRDQIGQLERDLTSPSARNLLGHLSQAIFENDGLLQDVGDRLFKCVAALSSRAQILNVTGAILKSSRDDVLTEDSTDNLILHTILDHARSPSRDRKGFFPENKNDFNERKVQDALRAAGVTYFRRADAALGWIASQAGDSAG